MRKIFIYILLLLLLFSCDNKKKQSGTAAPAGALHSEWVYDAVIYEVNTRQYTPEGTFAALSEHLPRLSELGVDILWFMPIQPIGEKDRKGTLGSYYSIHNYTEVNSEFGSLDDFKELVSKAHSLDMKVILDWVANHTARDAVWVELHPDWYVRDSLGELNVMYDWTDIAQLDYSKHDMREAMIEAMRFWLQETDIDGFRCDVAGEVPTDFWEDARAELESVKPDLFMLAEAEKPELNEKAFDAYYAWDFHHKMNAVAQGSENVDSLRASLSRMRRNFASHAIPMFFTSNHDENSWNGTEFERMGEAAPAFAALTYLMPGIPLIYSGQEVGLDKRLSFFDKDTIHWSTTGEQSAFYQALNQFKTDQAALFSPERGGAPVEIENDQPQSVWSFRRVGESGEVVALFNLSKEEVEVAFSTPFPGKGYILFPDGLDAEASSTILLQPWEYRLYFK